MTGRDALRLSPHESNSVWLCHPLAELSPLRLGLGYKGIHKYQFLSSFVAISEPFPLFIAPSPSNREMFSHGYAEWPSVHVEVDCHLQT